MHRTPGLRDIIVMVPNSLGGENGEILSHTRRDYEMRDRVRSLVNSVLALGRHEITHGVCQDGDVSVGVNGFEEAFTRSPKTKMSILSPVPPNFWTPHVTLYDGIKLMQDSELDIGLGPNLASIILGTEEFAGQIDDILKSRGVHDSEIIPSQGGNVVLYSLSSLGDKYPVLFDDMRQEFVELKNAMKAKTTRNQKPDPNM